MGKKLGILIISIGFLCTTLRLEAAPKSSRAAVDAIKVLAGYFINDLKKLEGDDFGRTAVFLRVDKELDQDNRAYLIKRLQELVPETGKAEIIQCFECEMVRGHSDGNKIIIEKGMTSHDAADTLSKALSIDTFLDANLGHTGNHIYLQVKLIRSGTDEIAFSKTYQIYARFMSDKSFLFSMDIGPAYILSATGSDDKYGLGTSVFFGERFYGFGRVGLGISNVFSFSNINFNQSSGPYISFNLNELSGKHMSWGEFSIFLNPGYSVNQRSAGLLGRGGLMLLLGNFMHIGAEYQHPIFSQSAEKKYPRSLILSVGFDLF
jgi:hypothetical protein